MPRASPKPLEAFKALKELEAHRTGLTGLNFEESRKPVAVLLAESILRESQDVKLLSGDGEASLWSRMRDEAASQSNEDTNWLSPSSEIKFNWAKHYAKSRSTRSTRYFEIERNLSTPFGMRPTEWTVFKRKLENQKPTE